MSLPKALAGRKHPDGSLARPTWRALVLLEKCETTFYFRPKHHRHELKRLFTVGVSRLTARDGVSKKPRWLSNCNRFESQ